MINTFETQSGITLELQAVSQIGLEELLYRLGFYEARTIEDVQSKALKSKDVYNNAIHQLFGFCCGFGVKTNPPEDRVEEMKGLGLMANSESVYRMNWLRWFVITDQQEAGQLVGAIMALTFEDAKIVSEENSDKE